MRATLLTLAAILLLAAPPALAEGGLMDDAAKARDNFFYKTYTGMLGNEARNGDQWSNLRLRELDKAVNMAEKGKQYEDTSWWSPIDKVSSGYGAWKASNDYFDASTQRREWEKKLADAGITPAGKQREQAAENTVKFLGIFSGTAREGGKLIDKMKEAEESAYKYHTTSWLSPIEKYKNGQEALKDAADANLQYKNVKNIAANDPFVRFGNSIAGIGSTIGNLFGSGNRTGSRDVYAGGSSSPTGRIRDGSSGSSSSDPFGLDAATRQIKRATADLDRSFKELSISFKGMGRELSRGFGEIGKQAGSAANGCTGPDCGNGGDRVNVNQVMDKLRNLGIGK